MRGYSYRGTNASGQRWRGKVGTQKRAPPFQREEGGKKGTVKTHKHPKLRRVNGSLCKSDLLELLRKVKNRVVCPNLRDTGS